MWRRYGVAWRLCWMFLIVLCLHDVVVLIWHGLQNAGAIAFAWLQLNDERCVFFAAASAISISQLPPRFAQDSPHFVSYTMAISSMALLFFALLVGCVVKHADGVRRSTPAEAMVEREVNPSNWLGTKCAQFGARKKWRWPLNTCECPYELPKPRNCEGTIDRTFDLKRTIKDQLSDIIVCHCEDPCPEYGANLSSWTHCRCPKDRPIPSKDCNPYEYPSIDIFILKGAEPGCRCLTKAEYMDQRWNSPRPTRPKRPPRGSRHTRKPWPCIVSKMSKASPCGWKHAWCACVCVWEFVCQMHHH